MGCHLSQGSARMQDANALFDRMVTALDRAVCSDTSYYTHPDILRHYDKAAAPQDGRFMPWLRADG